ncbi:MAG TPA: DUF4278 domain-containing protein [Oscillatoriales cyanobacterium M59_W2019_021]|nr:MAG: DUF4278 domain-containing protein [Cyanobacteria bacterium J055]HIK29988.1 DUF4278 domain-containing protein [Oscillatoriales cyanobacterium M4454_W2019_049]HIK49969.1 DUF4278 domain-containing protein [Oscillatoriales cyanobacterium M59_W2019_021]
MQDRGISYTASTESIETVETDIEAQFRGISYYISHPVNPPTSEPKNLKYRGVAYPPQPETSTDMLPEFG